MTEPKFSLLDRFSIDASRQTVAYPQEGYAQLAQFERPHFWFKVRREYILRTIKRLTKTASARDRKMTCLDIGCGTGFTAEWLTQQGLDAYGIDAANGFSSHIESSNASRFAVCNIFETQPKAEFDFILLLDVLEHLENDKDFMKRALGFLKPGGHAIVTVPAFMLLWSEVDEYSGHFRRYSLRQLSLMLKTLDVRFVCWTYFYMFTFPGLLAKRVFLKQKPLHQEIKAETQISEKLNGLLYWICRFESLLSRLFPLPFGSSLFVVIQKREAFTPGTLRDS